MASMRFIVNFFWPELTDFGRGFSTHMEKEFFGAELDHYRKKYFDKVTATFSTQPKWERNIKTKGRKYSASIYTHDDKFVFNAERFPGGVKRYAKLSPDYRRKTKRRKISSSRGGGRVLARGSAVSPMYAARHKIEPKEWHYVAAEREVKYTAKRMQRSAQKFVTLWFRKGKPRHIKVPLVLAFPTGKR